MSEPTNMARRGLLGQLATVFLRSTAKGSLSDAVPQEEPGAVTKVLRLLRVPALFRGVGRAVGFFLTPKMKARIQDRLINTYRIPVDLQADADELEASFRRGWKHLEAEVGAEALGDYLEFGVYQGASLAIMHRVLEERGLDRVRLFGFDSFEGLPETAEEEGVWSTGQYRAEIDLTRERLERKGVDLQRTTLVKGFFSDSLTPELLARHGIEKASVLMVDSDLYSSAVEALAFCAPLIRDQTVVYFDDWRSTSDGEGEQKAFAEFLEAHPEFTSEPFGTYPENAQIFLLRRVAAGA